MLQLTISPPKELWDEEKEEFVKVKPQTLRLEHSLVSLSKWEARWGEVFLSKKEKTMEQAVDYIKCMTLTQNVDPTIYRFLSKENFEAVNAYIDSPMTATHFSNKAQGRPSREETTAEVIYWQMIALNIPFECQKWHLNRLLTLIRVCDIKNQPPKKMGKRQIMERNTDLNRQRLKQLGTRG